MLISFRPCQRKDHPALLRLMIAYYRSAKIAFDKKSLSRGLDTLLRNASQGQAWFLENHKRPIGYGLLTYNFDVCYGGQEGLLIDLYVDKRYRQQGIGTVALYEIEDFCRERGIRTIQLQVNHHNKAAEKIYRKSGFQVLERKVLLMEVRSKEAAHAHRTSASKRR
jgi:ribosomal protein S18 acetylase RimI-like enzyme